MKGEALTDPQASMSAPPPSPTSSCSSSSSSAPSSPESTMLPLPPLPPSDPQPSYPNSYSNSLAHPHSKFAYTPFNPAISVDPIKVYPELADHSFSYQYDYDFGYECYSQGSPTRILMEETELPSNLRKRSTKDREQDRDRVPEKTQESPTLVAATRGGAVSRGIGRGFGSRGGGVTRADSLSSSEDSMSSPIIVSRGSTKVKLRTASSGNGYGRKREKAFRCPNAGCTKAYLNPNGLKYHLEKGTCKIEVTDDISIDILSSPSHSSVNTRGTPTSPTTVVTNIIRALSIPNVSSTPSGLNSRAQGQGDGGFRNAAPDHALSGSCSAGYFGDGGRQVQAVPPAPQLQASTQAQSQPQPDLQPQPHYHQPPQQNDMSMLATTSDAQVLMGQVIL
ncbi:hypothetical protein BDQ12DRAFT_240273 [Crucibulum laeve]|uniref:C2H2-type domain-containing protein n=1 Tax=Crucibulum laeve TaxID=68775 RepID=A0A5C3LVI8_9AGAR|nr:hypothetical protein BDQ12DRAFT_240273 [Crucibulum laeve]